MTIFAAAQAAEAVQAPSPSEGAQPCPGCGEVHDRHQPTSDEIKQQARRMAEGISSTLTDAERPDAGENARATVEGTLNAATVSSDPRMVAAYYSIAISKMLSMISKTPAGQVSKVLDSYVIAYSLAAGAVAGVYELPEAPEVDEAAIKAFIEKVAEGGTDVKLGSPDRAVKYL